MSARTRNNGVREGYQPMSTRVDLRQLAVDRGEDPPAPAGGRRHLLSRILLPALLLAAFGLLIAWAARDSLYPPVPVTVMPVLVSLAGTNQPADTPLFRAAGWVEPRPTPTLVTALAEGVVERLLVVDGQEVKPGQVVARLASGDARLALDSADADVKLRAGELAAVRAGLVAAQVRLDTPLHLTVEVADAEAALAKVETELTTLPFQLRAARSRQQFAATDLDRKEKNAAAIPENAILRAKTDAEAADAAVEELQARQKRLPVEVAALKDKRDALRQKLQRKTDEVRQLAEAEASVRVAEARVKQAEVARDVARLRLERMEVTAPTAGRVLAVVARPGMRLTGLNPGSLHDSSTVITLYDSAQLQVRVDVRLDDVGKVLSGQKARIESAALPGQVLDGMVLLASSQADVQKNTLSVKVAVTDPPSTLKPDMLCQVTFLAAPRPAGADPEGVAPYRLVIPRQLVDTSAEGSRVWVADRLTGTARLRRVDLGASLGDLVEVVSGLTSSDKLIVGGRDGLKDGDRIRVVGEDDSLGSSNPGSRTKPPGR
jgi:HlyD family secretion protein